MSQLFYSRSSTSHYTPNRLEPHTPRDGSHSSLQSQSRVTIPSIPVQTPFHRTPLRSRPGFKHTATTPATNLAGTPTRGRPRTTKRISSAGLTDCITIYPIATPKSDNYCSFCSSTQFGVTGVNIGEYLNGRDEPVGSSIPVDIFRQMDMDKKINITFKVCCCVRNS